MDATAWLGVAGIGGTLLGTGLGPCVSERVRRKGARADQFHKQRLSVYADLLRVTARLVDNASNWTSIPLAEQPEPDGDELDRLIAQANLLGGKEVDKRLQELSGHAHTFHRLLVLEVQPHHRQLRAAGQADDARAIALRGKLVGPADDLRKSYERLRDAMRKETRP